MKSSHSSFRVYAKQYIMCDIPMLFVLGCSLILLALRPCFGGDIPLISVSHAADQGVVISPSTIDSKCQMSHPGGIDLITVNLSNAFLEHVDPGDPVSKHRTRMYCESGELHVTRHLACFLPTATTPSIDQYVVGLDASVPLGYFDKDIVLDICSEKNDRVLMRISYHIHVIRQSTGFPPSSIIDFGSVGHGRSSTKELTLYKSNADNVLGYNVETSPGNIAASIVPTTLPKVTPTFAERFAVQPDYVQETGVRKLTTTLAPSAPVGQIDEILLLRTGSGDRYAMHVIGTVTP